MEIDMGIGGFEFVSRVTRFPGLVFLRFAIGTVQEGKSYTS